MVISLDIFLDEVEDLHDGERNQTCLFVTATHGEGLAGGGLAIGKHSHIDAFHGCVHLLNHLLIEDLLSRNAFAKDIVKTEHFLGADVEDRIVPNLAPEVVLVVGLFGLRKGLHPDSHINLALHKKFSNIL